MVEIIGWYEGFGYVYLVIVIVKDFLEGCVNLFFMYYIVFDLYCFVVDENMIIVMWEFLVIDVDIFFYCII